MLVLDTSAFIVGYDPLSNSHTAYSVPEVAQELSLSGMARTRFETAVESRRLIVKAPSEDSSRRISQESSNLGEKYVLSEADLMILALALDLRNEGAEPAVVSDDYAIQNMAERLGLRYMPLGTFGISYGFKWILYCPACFRRFPGDYSNKDCSICGTPLRRKVLRKRPAKMRLGERDAVT